MRRMKLFRCLQIDVTYCAYAHYRLLQHAPDDGGGIVFFNAVRWFCAEWSVVSHRREAGHGIAISTGRSRRHRNELDVGHLQKTSAIQRSSNSFRQCHGQLSPELLDRNGQITDFVIIPEDSRGLPVAIMRLSTESRVRRNRDGC